MDFIKVSIDTTPEGTELLPARLLSLGVEGVEIEEEGDFLRFVAEAGAFWDSVDEALLLDKKGVARVSLYLPKGEEGERTLARIRESLRSLPDELPDFDFGTLDITAHLLSSGDWEDAWKPYYKPVEIGERLLILPEWEPVPDTSRVIYKNDPGQSFGTGTHASTRLMLGYVEAAAREGLTVLDIGCGSGILSISALLLGARSAVAIDIDPEAANVARRNAERNGVPADRYRTLAGNILEDNPFVAQGEAFDLVFANIIADVILPLLPSVRALLREGGRFFASGILAERADDIARALAPAGLALLSKREEDGWAALEICTAEAK
ncbi:50S ribosomal protein L11 methyltransferase [Oscillospiraceae bacterium OttesenSCG-928-G22]|nr:50S ribosomal protein L11 methyltransferase [Oscillospiraceae bacterium OttesenSCG-928-G22]